jgi:hypothetical protein
MTDQQHPDSIIIKMKAEAGYEPTEFQEKYVKLIEYVQKINKQECDLVWIRWKAPLLLKEIGEL